MDAPFKPCVYSTPAGLNFWMDNPGPGETPTIRTEDPSIWIRILPEQFRYKEAFLMFCDGGQWIFTRPAASSMMDTDAYEDLRERNPHLDLAISAIETSYSWVERFRGNTGAQEHKIEANSGFKDRDQQNRVTGLFCDLMAWKAVRGASAMARGGYINPDLTFKPGLVGFDKTLQARLDAGDFLGR